MFAISFYFLIGCKVEPRQIDYNMDQCHACKMMIVDNRFGCELVTTKGKVFKYDAIECLVPEVVMNGEDYYEYILVTHFDEPAVLKNARESYYLIHAERPSPMGQNLSAYSEKMLNNFTEEWYTWNELVEYLR